MKVLSTNIPLELLQKGKIGFADIEMDMDREDGKLTIIRLTLDPKDVLQFKGIQTEYRNGRNEYPYEKITRAIALDSIKFHVGQIVADKLFEDEEKLINMLKKVTVDNLT